jgi:hypothetical protein
VIDFKYHVVSIVAVFLALAVGIVLGTNVLSGDVLKNLKAQTSQLRKEAQDLRAQSQQQQNQISADQNFVQAIAPMAVAGRLHGQHIVVISVPNAPKAVRDQATKTLTDAGAEVTAQVELAGNYDDPQQADALNELLKSLGTPTFDPTAPDDVPARAAAILASALVGGSTTAPTSDATSSTPTASATPSAAKTAKPSTAAKPSNPSTTPVALVTPAAAAGRVLDSASTEVLSGLQKAGFLKLDQEPTLYADMAVVVTSAAPAKLATPSPPPDTSLLDLVAAMQRAGSQTVVIGPAGSADPGGLVAQVRGNASLSKVVSAVDDADVASGRVAMVFALVAQTKGLVGQYGTGQGAQAPVATVVPANHSASPSAAGTPVASPAAP